MQSTSGSNQSRQQQPQLEQPSQQQRMGSMGQYSSAAMEIEQHMQETNFSYFVNQPPMRRQHHPPLPPQYQPSPSQNQPPPTQYHRPLPQYNPPLPQYHIPPLPQQYQSSPSQNQHPPSQYHRPLPQCNPPLPQYHHRSPQYQALPQQMFYQNKPGPAAEKDEIKTIYVSRLQDWMDEPYLYSCFASAGEVANVKIIRNKETWQSKGYGFVEFVSRATAEHVRLFYNGSTMPGTEKELYSINWAHNSTTFDSSDNLLLRVPDLAPRVTNAELQEMFAKYQSVISAEVDYISGGSSSRRYGYVRFGDANERRRAMAEVYGKYELRTPMQLVATPMQSAGNAHQHQQLYPF